MKVYSVNCGHFPTFNDAASFRKRKLNGAGSIFTTGTCYTVKLLTTFKEKEADDFKRQLEGKVDVWIDSRDTSVK